MAELVLIRGLPGSGKSTIAKAMAGYVHYEADMYFECVDGVYRFRPSEIAIAHQWCQAMAEDELTNGRDVVVANTFTQRWEIIPYVQIAKRAAANLRVITARGEFASVHDVPDEKIKAMRQRWEAY